MSKWSFCHIFAEGYWVVNVSDQMITFAHVCSRKQTRPNDIFSQVCFGSKCDQILTIARVCPAKQTRPNNNFSQFCFGRKFDQISP